jgi:DNA-binding CsgD family transcriptional regulator
MLSINLMGGRRCPSAMPLGSPLLNTLGRMNLGGVLLDASGGVVDINTPARRLLNSRSSRPDDASSPAEYQHAIRSLLSGDTWRHRSGEESWHVIAREARPSLIMHTIALTGSTFKGACTVIILIDLQDVPQPKPHVLKVIFGLTESESNVAAAIARGDTPNDIAEARGISLATVRSQLASIYAKTTARRQSELISLLARVSILP